jgi:hypothetical protein
MAVTIDGTNGITSPDFEVDGVTGKVYPLVSGTSQASTSGTSIDFTSIPDWVKRVTVMFNGVSTNGTSDVIIQLGTSGGFVSTGYLGASATIAGGATGSTLMTSGFLVRLGGGASAAAVRHGTVVLTLLGSNIWAANISVSISNTDYIVTGAGSIPLGGVLTQIRTTTAGGVNTFDAGNINILYE